ncbi:transposase [Chloroflexota bacterium]
MINQSNSKILCKYCQSDNVIKYGKYKGKQYYYCKACNRKFADLDTIPKMQYSTSKIAGALNMYYEGLSLLEIRRNLIQQHGDYISDATIFNWVNRFSKMAINEAKKYTPKVGGVWIADETFMRIDKQFDGDTIDNPYSKSRKAKWVVFWDIIDAKTRFLLASHATTTRTIKDAQILMEKAAKRAGRIPRIVYTDKLRAYLDGIELTFGADTEHRQGSPFEVGNSNNLIERFHGTIKERTKVMRALKSRDTLEKFMDGWLVHYNFFRPHMSLKDMTPAQVAGIRFPFRNWKDIMEQSYEKTTRIPVLSPELARQEVIKKNDKKRLNISKRRPRITPPMPSLSQIRRQRD